MKFGTCMLNRGHIVATIMNSKDKHFNEQFVTLRECNLIISLLREKFHKEKINVVILDNIDNYHFEIINSVIVPNEKNNVSIENIKTTYMGNVPTDKIANIIWDDSLIYSYLNEISIKKEKIEFEGSDLERIISKVLDNPNEFYERVAKELPMEEYNFIAKHLLKNHSCENCDYMNECYDKDILKCKRWSNDELVGKTKVLKKY